MTNDDDQKRGPIPWVGQTGIVRAGADLIRIALQEVTHGPGTRPCSVRWKTPS